MRETAGLVLLDLDGTLTDPFPGIYRSINHALDGLGRPPIGETEGRSWIGPPLHVSFLAHLGEAQAAERAVLLYRERFGAVGLYENVLVPGIREAMAELAALGYRMVVATSKVEAFAERIVEHFGLSGLLAEVYGAAPDGAHADKTELVAHVLASEDAHRGCGAVMVGDRMYDVAGARGNAIPAIGVAWGYAADGEFTLHPPDRVVAAPAELPAAVAALVGPAGAEHR